MKGKFPVTVYNGMTGVPSALIADDDIVGFGQQIDHAAFSLIAPVDPDNGTGFHLVVLPCSVYPGTGTDRVYPLRNGKSKKNV